MDSAGFMSSHITPVSLQQTNDTPVSSSSLPKATSGSRRRDKPQLSCNQCRRRKSRCDRQRPCSCCSTRGQTCTYPENSAATHPELSPAASSAHDRIVQLERLVMSMMPNPIGKSDRGPAAEASVHPMPEAATPVDTMPIETPIDAHSEFGSMRISDSELHYVGGDHWVAILDGIADLKDHLDREEQLRLVGSPDGIENDNPSVVGPYGGALILYGCRNPASRDEILSALPPKYAVDRYISRYFNYVDLVSSSTVHGPSFLREYDAFWADPTSAPIIWVGLLFSMICLACLASPPEVPEAEQQALQVNLYREKTVQCLVMGEYTKTGPYVLETVINYVYIEFGIHPDANKDMWLLLALEVNLARRMGYHRDPSHFPGISPFQGEMRRRLWATVLMSDTLVSNQMGMPRMISDWQYDTSEPRNLNDDHFDRNTTALPPSRPETELTTALGIIARTRMLKALGIISDLAGAVTPCSYTEIMRVDGLLHEAASSIPPPLKMKPITASLTDSPQVIIARLFIKHMFYKGQVMLHRRFIHTQSLHETESQDPYSYSRKTCLEASLGSLEIQHLLDEETRPGGQLHTMRWRVTSIMNHQFLTATMLLCSFLHREHGHVIEREAEIRAALQRARIIWMRRSTSSKEAKKAAETVNVVLSRAANSQSNGNATKHDLQEGQLSRGITPPTQPGNFGFNAAIDITDPYNDGQFVMSDFMGTFMSPNMQGQNPESEFDITSPGTLPEGWTTFVNWPRSI